MTTSTMDVHSPAYDSAPAGGHLWLWWVLASTVGWALGGKVGVAVASTEGIIVAGGTGLLLGGLLAGVPQWWVLRRHVEGAGWWVGAIPAAAAAAAAVGIGLGVIARLVAGERVAADTAVLLGTDVGWVTGVIAIGPLIGVLQWLVLRSQVRRAGWWVLASTVGWVLAGPSTALVGFTLGAALGLDLSWATFGAVYGAVTGAALVRLLKPPH